MLHIISSALKYARANGYISFIPYVERLSEKGNSRQGFFTDNEMERLMEFLPEYLQDYVLFAYLTGWRRSEVSSLTWDMVNLERRIILLPDSKNSEPRILPLVGELEDIISRRLLMRECGFVFHYSYRDKKHLPIKDFRHQWEKALHMAGLGNRLFHDFRRSAVKNSVPVLGEELTMRLCGHKTRTMMSRYNILVENDLRAGMEHLLSQKRPTFRNGNHK